MAATVVVVAAAVPRAVATCGNVALAAASGVRLQGIERSHEQAMRASSRTGFLGVGRCVPLQWYPVVAVAGSSAAAAARGEIGAAAGAQPKP